MKIKVVLVGCGGMSGAWLGAAQDMEDVELVGLVDVQEEAALKRAQDYDLHSAQVGTDLQEMLEKLHLRRFAPACRIVFFPERVKNIPKEVFKK